MIGGNINAVIQIKSTQKNVIGEPEITWTDVDTVLGWLDYQSGQADQQRFNSKIQETSHIFLCDYGRWIDAIQDASITSENCRMVIENSIYEVLMIDDPMNMHKHLEIYLKYIGGGFGVS